MVAPELDDFSGSVSSSNSSTHIYCKSVKVKDVSKSTGPDSGDRDSQRKNIISSADVPSSVVPIDISGQPFSRMASFRRSLIHVDFLIHRKKKKDKRRNTVAEGDVKELKDALQNIVNEEYQIALPKTISSYQQIVADSKNVYNTQVPVAPADKLSSERNNNTSNVNLANKSNCLNMIENKNTVEGTHKNPSLNKQINKYDKINEENILAQFPGKRKPKSHIPISTISAAMNVAVEMRQQNGIEMQNSISNSGKINSRNQINSECVQMENRRPSDSSLFTDDDASQESWQSYKKRLQEKCRSLANKKPYNLNDSSKDIEGSSSASSDITSQEKIKVYTSTESDTYFISSDESDNDSADIIYFEQNHSSTTSLCSVSDGSLNSLLSETGTEMTSSTGTLTSIGQEYMLNSPPPPPPMILSAIAKDNVTKIAGSSYIGHNLDNSQEHTCNMTDKVNPKTKKQLMSPKKLKSQKSILFDVPGISVENSKNIFSSLVGLKTNSKEKNKSKKVDKKKISKTVHQPAFDMYGHNSPKKVKKVSAFIKESNSPTIQIEEKNSLKSFSVNVKNSSPQIDPKIFKTSTPNNVSHSNPSYINHTLISDFSKRSVSTASNIPQKYEHQVTVTPIQRHINKENKTMYCKGTSIKENEANEQNSKYENSSRLNVVSTQNQLPASRIQRPEPPISLYPERSKLAARVVLDFDGKVVYSTNSLDRKYYTPNHVVNMHNGIQNKNSESCYNEVQKSKENNYYKSCHDSYTQNIDNYVQSNYNSSTDFPHDTTISLSHRNQNNHSIKQNRCENECFPKIDACFSKQREEILHINYPQYHSLERIQSVEPKRVLRPNSFAGTSSNIYIHSPADQVLPDPNISGLPIQEPKLTKYNVNLHSKQMEKMNIHSPEEIFNMPSNSFYSSPLSEKNGSIFSKSPQSTISTEDLFAVIHDCKKRMNIKTDSDISLASSSRSNSPSYLRPSSSKGTLAETGFLSPRNQMHLETSGDRRSWADFRPIDSVCSERKSLASDRLGPTKPTSMHDFKMLLLQARSSSQISGPRKSAVEMLKVPHNQSNQNKLKAIPLSLSPRNSISFPVPNLPPSELSNYNGHSTVPFKRGNRVRSSLQFRYTMYPPIFEDCSEDLENSNDLYPNKFTEINTTENKKDASVEWNHNVNNSHEIKIQDYSYNSENNFQSS